MRTVLGKVVSLTGEAEVVDQHGQHKLLKAGDTLHEGEHLVTAAGSQVAMQAANGEILQFAEQQSVKLSAALSGASDLIDISEHAVNPAVIQHLLTALQQDNALIDLSPPLASMLQEDTNIFISIAHASITEHLFTETDALNINDVLISGESAAIAQPQVMPVTQVADLMTQTTTAIDIGLPESPLKDFLGH